MPSTMLVLRRQLFVRLFLFLLYKVCLVSRFIIIGIRMESAEYLYVCHSEALGPLFPSLPLPAPQTSHQELAVWPRRALFPLWDSARPSGPMASEAAPALGL